MPFPKGKCDPDGKRESMFSEPKGHGNIACRAQTYILSVSDVRGERPSGHCLHWPHRRLLAGVEIFCYQYYTY